MKKILFIIKYLKYWLSSSNAHGIHSPFVFNLYNEVINKESNYYAFEKIELLRKKLLRSLREIDVTDLGAGKSGKRSIADIAEHSAKSKKYGELLFKLVYHFKPAAILELGTSLGISTSYLASANPNAKLITIEGCPNTALEAKRNFELLGFKNIESITGNFDTVLPSIITQLPIIGCQFIFIDGNHRKEPTLNYFKQLLPVVNTNSIHIFDDIHWSDEMEQAWEEIKKHPKVTVTIDLFFIGIVFFREEQAKENFILRF